MSGRHPFLLVLSIAACAGPTPDPGIDAASGMDAGGDDATVADDTGTPGSDAGGDGDYACDPAVGLSDPLAVCSEASPCTRLIVSAGSTPITTPSDVPTCVASAERGGYDDGAPQTWIDADGNTRYACVYVPPTASASARVPLVVFWHGAGSHADDAYTGTSLRGRAPSYDLSGDAARAGFALVSIQGRNLHWPTLDPRDGPHHDQFHRDLAAPSSNRDIALGDTIIDEMVAGGTIDPSRIYVMGWSNGGFFAQLYAIARHDTATPGGNRVAAASVYTAADPFRSPRDADAGRCDLSPVPTTSVPIHIVSRSCDIIACDDAQVADLVSQGYVAPPGVSVRTWSERLVSELHDPNTAWQIVTGTGMDTTTCTGALACGEAVATLNHVRWPDGVADRSGIDHEPLMLDFLRDHPLD